MFSFQGKTTIYGSACYQQPYDEHEMKAGLKQLVSQDQLDKHLKGNVYHRVQPKVVTNSQQGKQFQMTQNVLNIRKRLENKRMREKTEEFMPGFVQELREFENAPNKKKRADLKNQTDDQSQQDQLLT